MTDYRGKTPVQPDGSTPKKAPRAPELKKPRGARDPLAKQKGLPKQGRFKGREVGIP